MMPVGSPAGGGMSASSSSTATSGDARSGDIYGGSFNTGYFGGGTDWGDILQKGMIPLTVIGLVALVWLLNKKK